MTVSISLVSPSVEVIFDDDVPQILSAVDADTVLGRVPGTTGLLVLEATTPDEAMAAIGAASQAQASAFAVQAVGAHAMAIDPHPAYVRTDELPNLIPPSVSHGHDVAAHARSPAAHPDRPTFDQSILFSSFFGG